MRRFVLREITVIGTLAMLGGSCSESLGVGLQSEGRSMREALECYFEPLNLGMTESEVKRRMPGYQEALVIIRSSQMAPGGTVTLPSGTEAVITYDDQRRVSSISTRDSRIKLPRGIRVGSTLREVRNQYPNSEIVEIPYFARAIELGPSVWIADSDHDGEDVVNWSVSWIELRASPY